MQLADLNKTVRIFRAAMVILLFCGGGCAAPDETLGWAQAHRGQKIASDIAPSLDGAVPLSDYVFREAMIPMRDGARLYTVILMKKGVEDGPILLSRTPYDAARWSRRNDSHVLSEVVPIADQIFVEDGYIRVFQDVRGRNRSEGVYVLNRPLRGPLNPMQTDHATDAYDTIDWLVKNIPETNGNVALNGSSYPGFTALMATIDPHPALKAVVSMSPMVDGWKGDDWFHNGAFRQTSFDFMAMQTVAKGNWGPVPVGHEDQYAAFLEVGSAGAYAEKWGLTQLPFVGKLMRHVTYDDFWRLQAVDLLLKERDLTVPIMLVMAQWDQEDSYGAPAVYRALKPKDIDNSRLFYVLGPWRHSGVLHDGAGLGPLTFGGDTAAHFRKTIQKPFLDEHLKPDASAAKTPAVVTFATGVNEWRYRNEWPAGEMTPLYLGPKNALVLNGAAPRDIGSETYVSDPNNPVPIVPRPVQMNHAQTWRTWLLHDQRFASSRQDVLTYVSAPLDAPLEIAGQPLVDLFAATSGTDSDWVVKLIDVYPDGPEAQGAMSGYQLPIGMEIFRGRYVDSFSNPRALKPNTMENYKFNLPDVNHVFLPGHRIMVQIQSSWFPLYDRNPQTYVESIFHAEMNDYQKAEQRVFHGGDAASAIWLPVVE